jgi:nucleotide-binding universal stress UspA family protein
MGCGVEWSCGEQLRVLEGGVMNTKPMVVGVDYSPSSETALSWALETAARRQVPLRIVHVCEVSQRQLESVDQDATRMTALLVDQGQLLLDKALEVARTSHPEVETSVRMGLGSARDRLVQESVDADLVVVGNRGLGGFTGMLLGSTALFVTSHARCTVVAVPTPSAVSTQGLGVVVGVDDPGDAQAALDFAFHEANTLHEPLTAVHAWHMPYIVGPAPGVVPPLLVDFELLQEQERLLLDDALGGWQEKFPEVDITKEVVCERPASALVDRAKGARLLVVGTRGRSELRGLMLGSVGHAVLHHARRPVAVVRSLG